MHRVTTASTFAIACLMLSAPLLLGADPASAPAVKWETSLGMGANLASGNSKTMTANVRATTERKGAPSECRFLAEANYGEAEALQADGSRTMEKNVQNAHGLAEYKYVSGGRNYAGLSVDILQDDIADLDYRLTVGPSVGRYLVKTERNSLNAELGVVYIRDRVASATDGRVAYRAFERWVFDISKTARVWESAEYLPTSDEFGRYQANAEIGAEAAMNGRISLRVIAQDKYNSDPAAGKDKNDVLLTAGVAIKM
jgi:putative salt-induced outer membrane protein YdiY